MTKRFPLPLPVGTDTHVITQLGATDYTQSAVHFVNGVSLTSADGFGTPSVMSFSFWFDMPTYTAGSTDFNFFNIQNIDNSDQGGVGFVGTEHGPAPRAGALFNYWPSVDDASFTDDEWPNNNLTDNQWHHLLCVVAGDCSYTLYVDDQWIPTPPQTDIGLQFSTTLSFLFDMRGPMTLPIFGNATGQDFYMADVWIAPGVDLRDSNGLIPEATRRQFVSDQCQPVDPATNWPTSAVQFYGDAAAFVTNRGTGPSFTLTGVLEDTGAGASPGARVQINGLKGGIYNVAAYADDWTGSAAYALCPTYGYNVGMHQFASNEVVNLAYPAGPMVIQKYGVATPDVAITRIQTTLAGFNDKPTVFNGVTDDTPFFYAGGCGYNGTLVDLACADWNSSSVDFEILQPNGQWITLQTWSANAQVGFTLPAGTYRLSGADTLNAPIYGAITPISYGTKETYNFVGITEVTDTFTLAGGVYGLATSCTDNTGASAKLMHLMPDGTTTFEHDFTLNQALQPYLPGGTFYVDPTNLVAPLTLSITGCPLVAEQECYRFVTTDDIEFPLKGTALEYQIAHTSADWPESATIALEYQTPDGSWVSIPNMTSNVNEQFYPTSGAGMYRITGVGDLINPLYIGMSNTPAVSTDTHSFTNLTSAVEFELQGGQYTLSYSSYNNDTAQWHLNILAADQTTWINVANNGDTAGTTSWQWYATGRYQIDASAMTNGININIASLPL